jgi:uncharacterized protein (TIGR00251 family)
MPAWLRETTVGVSLAVKVQSRAAHSAVARTDGPELHVRVAAPPVDDAANEELLRFLARVLACPRATLHLRRGARSRHKAIEIGGLSAAAVLHRLGAEA